MACRAISESLSIHDAAARSRVAQVKRQRADLLSEKQYSGISRLGKKLSIFLSSARRLNQALYCSPKTPSEHIHRILHHWRRSALGSDGDFPIITDISRIVNLFHYFLFYRPRDRFGWARRRAED
jgi:hypothetical protein